MIQLPLISMGCAISKENEQKEPETPYIYEGTPLKNREKAPRTNIHEYAHLIFSTGFN